jgi:sugar-phosphatase
MPDAINALNVFKTLDYKIGVCSAKNLEELAIKLDGAGVSEYFPIQVRSTQVEANNLPKPHPDMYILACKKLELEPKQCLAFEDTSAGVKAAKSAGLRTYAMPNKYSQGQDFSMADEIIPGGWSEVLNNLAKFRII